MPTALGRVLYVRGEGNGGVLYKEYPVSGQTLSRGQMVALSSGLLVTAKAAGNNLGSGDKLVGFLMHDVTSDMTTAIVAFAGRPNIITLPVYHGTPASAVTAAAQRGTAYEVRNHTGNIPCVDIGSTTNTKATVVDINKRYAVGEQYGLLDVRFHDQAVQTLFEA